MLILLDDPSVRKRSVPAGNNPKDTDGQLVKYTTAAPDITNGPHIIFRIYNTTEIYQTVDMLQVWLEATNMLQEIFRYWGHVP